MDQVLHIKKPPHPRQNASILSIITFGYTFPILTKGYAKNLNEEDIPEVLHDYKTSMLGDKLEANWKIEKSSSKSSLWRALGRSFGKEFMLQGIFLFVDQICFRLMRPLALIQLVKVFSENEKHNIKLQNCYFYGGIIILTSVLSIFVNQLTYNRLQLLAMKIRSASASLIYRKSLSLSQSSLQEVAIGHITNLLANDLKRFEDCVFSAHSLWLAPLEIVLTLCILYHMVGISSTVGILFMAILVPIQVYFGKKCSTLRLQTAIKTDERVRLMSEILNGIKVIKMYAWEKPFAHMIGKIRRLEAREIRAINYVRGFMKFVIITPKIAVFLAIVTYLLTGNNVTAVYVFAVTCFYENLRISLTIQFIVGIANFSEVLITVRRIQALLLKDEVYLSKQKSSYDQTEDKGKMTLVDLKNVSAKWSNTGSAFTLDKINLHVEGNQLIGICGPVGSGKSSILLAILNELRPESGSINIQGKIAYSSQEPWIFTGNIQKNILFGLPMELQRYARVLKVCALERDLSLLPYGDQTVVGERGVTLSGGQKARVNLARAIYQNADIYLLDDPFSAVDSLVAKHIFEQCIKEFLNDKCTLLVTYQMQYSNLFDKIYFVDAGKVVDSGTCEKLQERILSFRNQACNSTEGIYEMEEVVASMKEEVTLSKTHTSVTKESRNTGGISKHVFMFYINSGKSLGLCLLTIAISLIASIAYAAGDYFTAFWVVEEQKKLQENYVPSLPESNYASVYTGLVLILTITVLLRSYLIATLCTRISINIHDKMFINTVSTSLNFFHDNHSGIILNRFSKDMGIIDESIPAALAEFTQIFLGVLGSAVIISIANPWMAITAAVIFCVFYFLRTIYIRTSRDIARLEGTARSPIFGHVNETLQGITTIRSSGLQLLLQNEFDAHYDIHNSVWYFFITCARSFSFYSDLVCVFYITAITINILLDPIAQYGGNIGMSITQGISLLTSLQWGLFQSCALENQMTSVERVLEYTTLQPEEENENGEPPNTWPEYGKLSIKQLSLKYKSNNPYVLKTISLNVESKQKIGVVGRTGAGKSSLITALFQLSKTEGSITIDDMDITKIPLHTLRSRISIIPQDPVIFSGTIRSNLDPFSSYHDEDLWSALEDVELKAALSKLPLGLNHIVSDGGANFSVGQKQLLCLGRAVLRKNKILVLDEATANVDPETDTLIQNTIRNKFSNCTVLTIAHRLNTIMDSDKVLVMDAGEVVEFNHPHILLQNKNGMFALMVENTGTSMANLLYKIAKESYEDKQTRNVVGLHNSTVNSTQL